MLERPTAHEGGGCSQPGANCNMKVAGKPNALSSVHLESDLLISRIIGLCEGYPCGAGWTAISGSNAIAR